MNASLLITGDTFIVFLFFLKQGLKIDQIPVQLHYCAAAGHDVLLSHSTTIWLHFALRLIVDAPGEDWLQTGCRNNVSYTIWSKYYKVGSCCGSQLSDGESYWCPPTPPPRLRIKTNQYDTSKKKKRNRNRGCK